MAEDFGKGNVLVADPPVVEAQGDTEDVEGSPGHERYDNHVEKFLLVVGECGQESVWVLGEMVGSVVLPEEVDVVHSAMIYIEPKVENNTVESDLKP